MPAGSRAGSLDTYWEKRQFDETPEPRGRPGRHQGRRQGHVYIIQKHAARRLHYDFRLELDGVLKSWAVTRGPSLDPAQKRLAVRTEDHPIDYARFEGTIPQGHYGGGTVMLWDRGSWDPIGDPHEGLAKGKLAFHLHGERLKGRWALVRFKGSRKGERKSPRENWLLIKELDDEVDRDRDVLEDYDTSVATDRSLDEIASAKAAKAPRKAVAKESRRDAKAGARKRHKLPGFVAPELATLVDAPPKVAGWLFEMKFDGYRALLSASGEQVRIYTRNGHDWTDRFGRVARAGAKLGLDGALIDGEVVVLDHRGRTDFGHLQRALKGEEDSPLSYFAFDLLAEGGADLRKLPLTERKERLRRLLGRQGRDGPIYFTDHVEGGGDKMLAQLCRHGFEGIIAKRAEARYRSGRGHDWLKVKCGQVQEFVIAGWSPSTKRRPFSSLILAVREKGALRYAGRVGSGFDEAELDELGRRFAKLARKDPAIGGEIPASVRRGAKWIRPVLVAEVAFANFTRDGLVRQARYLGLREDKPARAVKREVPEPVEGAVMATRGSGDVIAGVKLSHPDKVLYEEQGITKRDLAHYFQKVAPLMLPGIENRLVSLVRCPEGSAKACFFQRHAHPGMPTSFGRVEVEGSDKKREAYLVLKGMTGLIAAAQFGVLEIHVWGSTIDDIERPNRLVFDLDPGDGVDFAAVKHAAVDLRDTLAAIGLDSVPMLTGGKGVHVVVPIARRHEWPVVKAFCRAVAERLADAAPDRFIATMAKAKRKGLIFIDYLRNDRSATAVAPFSPRARAGAPVAWPVEWAELGKVAAAGMVTIDAVLAGKRKAALWKTYPARQALKAEALRAVGVKSA